MGVTIKILESGNGNKPQKGNIITVHYTGKLVDGTVFDSSIPKGRPYEFVLGRGSVIKGWEEGIKDMSVGEVSELTITPDLGYGESGFGGIIPPNATLIFEIKLLEFRPLFD